MSWEMICNEQGWDEESQIIHLEAFIRSRGLDLDLAVYAAAVAAEENGGPIEPELDEFKVYARETTVETSVTYVMARDADHARIIASDPESDLHWEVRELESVDREVIEVLSEW